MRRLLDGGERGHQWERSKQIKPRWTTAVYLVSDDRTQELGLTLLGRVPMPASYPHLALA